MTQRTWTHDPQGNAQSADWSSGWTNGTPVAGDIGFLNSDLPHPYTITHSAGSDAIGELDVGGPGTLSITGGTLAIGAGYIGDIVSPGLNVAGGTVDFGTARIFGMVQSSGRTVFDAGGEVNGDFRVSGGTVSVSAGALLINDDPNYFAIGSATETLDGSFDGGGILRVGNFRNNVFGAGVVLNTASLALDSLYGGTGTFALAGDVFYGGVVAPGTGSVTIDLAGHTLSLAQIGDLNASLVSSTGAGTLLAAGSLNGTVTTDTFSLVEVATQLLAETGTILAGDQLRIDVGASVTVGAAGSVRGTVVVLGSLELADGSRGPDSVVGSGAVQVDAGTLTLQSIGSGGFDGDFIGNGALVFGGETNGTLTSGAALTIGSTAINGTLTVAGTDHDYGALTVDAGYLIANGSLFVGGLVRFAPYSVLGGTGRVVAQNGLTIDTSALFGGVTLENYAAGVASFIKHSVLVGDSTGAAAIQNDFNGTLNVGTADIFNQNFGTVAHASLLNYGLVISNSASINTDVLNDATIKVPGTADFLQIGGTYTDNTPDHGLDGSGTVGFAGPKAIFNLTDADNISPRLVVGTSLELAGSYSASATKSLYVGGGLTMLAGSVIDLGQLSLSVAGTSVLQGTITGVGHLASSGPQSYLEDAQYSAPFMSNNGALTLAGNAALFVDRTSSLGRTVTIGDNSTSKASLQVDSTGTLTLLGGLTVSGPSVGRQTGGGTLAPFANTGTVLFASPGATAWIGVVVSNTGASANIQVAGGTLVLGADVIGYGGEGGKLKLGGGGTLELGHTVDATQSIIFTDANGFLKLDAPSLVAASISMHNGDSIDLVGLNPVHWHFAGGTLSVDDGVHAAVDLTLGSQDTGVITVNTDGHGGALVTACFAADTRMTTPHGEVPVQALRIGDSVTLARGGHAAVVWLGHRRVDCRRHPRPDDVMPVRVRAHAFGPGQPDADLLLSPDHAVFIDNVLIPIRHLLNGATVQQEPVDTIIYWHVELARHDVLLAHGLPVESYLDTGNRAAFENAGAAVMLHPDFALKIWHERACARLVVTGPKLAAARRRLRLAAVARGYRLTDDPDLRIEVDGHPIPVRIEDETWHVSLPKSARTLGLLSRCFVPAQLHPGAADARQLGIAVSRLTLDGRDVAPTDPRLRSGWHAFEPEAPAWRWTAGAALIDPAGARRLSFALAMRGRYWVAPDPAASSYAASRYASCRANA